MEDEKKMSLDDSLQQEDEQKDESNLIGENFTTDDLNDLLAENYRG